MSKLVWRVKLVMERQPGVTTETELACIKREAQADLADLGLSLSEAKQLAAALQAEIVPTQVAALGERPRACLACGRRLASKGYSQARFRSLFGDVPVRVRRLLACPCQAGVSEAKSVAVLGFGKGAAVAPELAYVTARYAALAPFGKVAALLSDLLPVSGTQHASTVRSRTLRVGTEVVQANVAEIAPTLTAAATGGPVVVGLDGGYVRSRHRAEGRRFEVIAGKVITADGAQHRFAFTRTGSAATTGGHSVGCHADNGRPEPKRTSLISLVRPATVRFLDGSGIRRQRAVSPSTECVPQTSGVPQLPTTFWGRRCSRPVHPLRCLHDSRRYALRKPGECRAAHLDDLGTELVGAATTLLILLTTTSHLLRLAIWDMRMDSVVKVIVGRKRRQH